MAAQHTHGPWSYAEVWRPRIGNMPPQEGERVDRSGNVFWGYSISGSNEHGGHILPTLAAVHNFPLNIEANARLIAACPDLLDAAKNFLGLFDNPVYRRRLAGDALYADAIEHARAAVLRATGATS